MAPQKLKFTIRQDGTISEEVIGIIGDSCQELTKTIEEKLGDISYREKKPEFYQTNTTEENVTLQHHQD